MSYSKSGRLNPHPNAYTFHVDEFALGQLDGRAKRFFTAVHYPADNAESYLSYDERKDLFRFHICPLAAGEASVIPKSRASAFPWDEAPLAAQCLDGEFGIADIIGRGISFIAEEGEVKVTRSVPIKEVEKSGPNSIPLGDMRGMGRVNARGMLGSSIRPNHQALKDWTSHQKASAASSWSTPPSTKAQVHELRTITLRKCILTVNLRRPPRFFVPLTRPDGETYEVDYPVKGGKLRYRQATARDFVKGGDSEGHAGSLELGAEQVTFRVSTCLSYRFVMCLDASEVNAIGRFLDKFRLVYSADPVALATPSVWGSKSAGSEVIDTRRDQDKRIHMDVWPTVLRDKSHESDKSFRALPFTVRWLVDGLVSHNIVLEHERPTLVKIMEEVMPVNATNREHREKVTKWRERVLTVMFNEERIAVQDLESFMKRCARIHRRPATDEPPHVKRVYRVHVTPTKLLVFPPEAELTNSVLRHFGKDKLSNRFLRVAFTDEDDRLRIDPAARHAHEEDETTGVLGRVQRALDDGLLVAGRRYRFLASSASQLKDASAWYLNDGPDLNVGFIRAWAGSVEEKVIAKFAARLGQPFSSTTYVNVRGKQLDSLPDIKRNGFIFTDGCGTCAPDIAKEAARALGHTRTKREARPSAMQVRIGGCKGVLAVNPCLEALQYALRDSMKKFESDLVDLNVVRVSEYHPGHLNRQYITILSHLGIPDETFFTRFREERDRIKGLPQRFAEGIPTKADMKLVRTMSIFPSEALVETGFNVDPCLQEILRVLETRLLWDLKWKARLPIAKGCFLIGVCDETGLLGEGEVFVQLDDPEEEGRAAFVLTGDVVVCRPPVLHPGDVRRVKAVDRPELRHFKNVVVFNVKGARDLPNLLSGGDLDGDDYTCLFDDAFLFRANAEPMNYCGPTPKTVSRICEADLKENVISYLKNDQLGAIGSAHLAWADMKGPASPECLELATLHSTAVDFAKTGVPANYPDYLRPRKYPIFMGKPKGMSYESTSILGKLFRLVGPEKQFLPSTESQIQAGFDGRLAATKVPEQIVQLAVSLKRRYDHDLWTLLLRYRLTEAEAMAGLVLYNARRKRGKDADLKDPVREAFGLIVTTATQSGRDQLQDLAFTEASVADGGPSPEQLLAVACYQVAYDKRYEGLPRKRGEHAEDDDEQNEGTTPTRLISFAWVLFQDIITMSGIAPPERLTTQ